MKAQELRIGNYFISPSGKIGKISYHEIRLLVVAMEKPDYNPIPLTEEWLLKFGFNSRNIYKLNDIEIGLVDDDFVKNQYTVRYGSKYLKIKHVHQLQNLYFALTGEEVKIKE